MSSWGEGARAVAVAVAVSAIAACGGGEPAAFCGPDGAEQATAAIRASAATEPGIGDDVVRDDPMAELERRRAAVASVQQELDDAARRCANK